MSIRIELPQDKLMFRPSELPEYKSLFLRKPGGIYALYNNGETCLYVGKSVDLYQRIRTHLSSSSFRDEISNIIIYFCNNEGDRDIYETFAINEFGAIYNRDKVTRKKPLRCNIEMLDELQYELYDLLRMKSDIVYELSGIDAAYGKPGKRRLMNNFTGEISIAYMSYLDDLAYFRENTEKDYMEDKTELLHRLGDIDVEISEVRKKLERFSKKVRT